MYLNADTLESLASRMRELDRVGETRGRVGLRFFDSADDEERWLDVEIDTDVEAMIEVATP
jgi:hypothetical protein